MIFDRKRVLVLAHTREIIKQISAKLFEHGIEHGLIQAGYMTRPFEPVQVASIQTLWARAVRGNRMELPAADLLIIDESHHCPATTYRKIIDAYPHAVLVGLTATHAAVTVAAWAASSTSSSNVRKSPN